MYGYTEQELRVMKSDSCGENLQQMISWLLQLLQLRASYFSKVWFLPLPGWKQGRGGLGFRLSYSEISN